MADLLASYQGLSASSPRADVSTALNAIISCAWPIDNPSPALTFPQHSPLTIQTARPSSLPFYQISSLASLAERMAGFSIQVLSATLVSRSLTNHSFSDVHLALSTIKALGRHPSGSTVVASDNNLSTLLAASKSFKDSNLEASLEALRCIANALLLVESARATLINGSVNGGEYAILLLEVGRS